MANDPAEAMRLVSFSAVDADAAALAPDGSHELRFEAGALPPVGVLGSVSASTAADMNLIDDPAGRYSVGSRSPGLVRYPDGGLTRARWARA